MATHTFSASVPSDKDWRGRARRVRLELSDEQPILREVEVKAGRVRAIPLRGVFVTRPRDPYPTLVRVNDTVYELEDSGERAARFRRIAFGHAHPTVCKAIQATSTVWPGKGRFRLEVKNDGSNVLTVTDLTTGTSTREHLNLKRPRLRDDGFLEYYPGGFVVDAPTQEEARQQATEFMEFIGSLDGDGYPKMIIPAVDSKTSKGTTTKERPRTRVPNGVQALISLLTGVACGAGGIWLWRSAPPRSQTFDDQHTQFLTMRISGGLLIVIGAASVVAAVVALSSSDSEVKAPHYVVWVESRLTPEEYAIRSPIVGERIKEVAWFPVTDEGLRAASEHADALVTELPRQHIPGAALGNFSGAEAWWWNARAYVRRDDVSFKRFYEAEGKRPNVKALVEQSQYTDYANGTGPRPRWMPRPEPPF